MPSRKDSPPPYVDPVKKQMFLTIMHTAIAAASAGDPDESVLRMSMAVYTSEYIPEDMSASEAASEYAYHLLKRKRDEDPPLWTGLLSRAQFEAKRRQNPIEVLVGDEWHVEDPRWLGLPGDSIEYLNMLAHIRERETATFDELLGVLVGIDPKRLGELLADAEEGGQIRRSSTPDGPVWETTGILRASRPKSAEVEALARQNGPFLSQSKEGYAPMDPPGRRRLPKEDLHLASDAKVILSILRASKGMAASGLGKQLPHLNRYALHYLLKRLRNAGHIQMLGFRRAAVWQLVPPPSKKRANSKQHPRAPQPLREREETQKREEAEKAPPRRQPKHPLHTEEELVRVERFVTDNPGCRLGDIMEGLQWEGRYRLHGLTEKLYGRRRIYRRNGLHYPGKDPAWE
ncbi:hypothetical protein [Aureimonas psammosilenae]|uniref:hypothetical protein n=1 Tax=Aureimonas psammosilenae TaxID=2495496 RepID=UPI001260CA36|nr:hypothetical protein [Aureimonas psammosilenae]